MMMLFLPLKSMETLVDKFYVRPQGKLKFWLKRKRFSMGISCKSMSVAILNIFGGIFRKAIKMLFAKSRDTF